MLHTTPGYVGDVRVAPDGERVAFTDHNVWGDDRGDFPEPPEEMYRGSTIRVTGYVEMYDGVPQIEVTSPGDIEAVN